MTYTQVADAKIISLFQEADVVPSKAIALFNHVLNAQHIWACRILSIPPEYGVWQEHHPREYEQISALNFKLLAQVLQEVDLDLEVTYVNSSGERFVNQVKSILLHVFNHSTYHRAQIASLFSAAGIQPPVTDYILLKRDGEL